MKCRVSFLGDHLADNISETDRKMRVLAIALAAQGALALNIGSLSAPRPVVASRTSTLFLQEAAVE